MGVPNCICCANDYFARDHQKHERAHIVPALTSANKDHMTESWKLRTNELVDVRAKLVYWSVASGFLLVLWFGSHEGATDDPCYTMEWDTYLAPDLLAPSEQLQRGATWQ